MSPPPVQAEESIHFGKVIGVGVAALLLFTAATLVAYRFQTAREKELQPLGPDALPRQVGQAEIGIVDQVPFDVTRSLQNYRDERNRRLETWGWVDRKNGIVHMPVEEAMDRLIKEQKK